jgi:hypothetical protein
MPVDMIEFEFDSNQEINTQDSDSVDFRRENGRKVEAIIR